MTTSFADVRDFVMGGDSDCCSDPDKIEHAMQSALISIWAMIPDNERRLVADLTTSPGVSAYELAGGHRISNLSFGLCLLERRTVACPSHCNVAAGRCGCPLGWSQDASGVVHLHPTPTETMVLAYQYIPTLDTTLYDINLQDLRVWRLVPLPERWLPPYRDMVRSEAMAEADPIRASNLLTKALGTIQLMRNDQGVPPQRGIVMNRVTTHRRPRYTTITGSPEIYIP